MTNREETTAAQHETFPGPGPLRADEAKRGIRPVEQMVDAAIDRIAREHEVPRERDSGIVERGGPVAAGPTEVGQALALSPQDQDAASTALATAGSMRRAKGRLRWKGLDVSEEFRRYADRVARGEDLPPFQGKILAEPDPAFPWNASDRERAQSRALQRQLGLWTGVALFLGLSVWVLVVQVGKQTGAPALAAEQAAASPLAKVVLDSPPSAAPPQLESPPALEAPVATIGSDEAAPASPEAAPGALALASLQERSSPAALATPPVTASSARAAVSSGATSVPPAPASTPHPVGVFVATRPAPGDLVGSNVPAAGSIQTPGAASPLVLGSEPAPGAAVAPETPSSAEPAASAAHTDPKKEPGREASAIGPLLVENPSF
ncbi:MAG: hypothetical protein ABI895_09745 [Deltaproteobacteria bacterium]